MIEAVFRTMGRASSWFEPAHRSRGISDHLLVPALLFTFNAQNGMRFLYGQYT
jgi:hypothetical protein